MLNSSFFRAYLRNHKARWGPYHKNVCAQCPFAYTTWEEHKMHVRQEHGDKWKYVCGLCELQFNTKDERGRHRRDEHESRLKDRVRGASGWC